MSSYPQKGADVSQLEVSKAEAAEERSEQTRSFVRTVKAAARRKYTPEEKIRIVLEGFRLEVTVNDLFSTTRGTAKERLTRDSVRDATQHEVGQLKHGELKEPSGRSVAGGVPSQKNGYPSAPGRSRRRCSRLLHPCHFPSGGDRLLISQGDARVGGLGVTQGFSVALPGREPGDAVPPGPHQMWATDASSGWLVGATTTWSF